MKIKNLFSATIAALAMFVGCTTEGPTTYDEIQLSSSFVTFPAAGASVTVEASLKAAWEITGAPAWLTVSPATGEAGEYTITFQAGQATETRQAELKLACGDVAQTIKVLQQTAKVETPLSTCKECMEGPDGNYRVKGVVTKITNTQYGNLYINDGSGVEAYIYGTLDATGAEKNFLSLGIEVGDIIEVEGPKTVYGTTPELVNVTVLAIEKSLIKVESYYVGQKPAEGDDAVKELPVKGGDLNVELTVKGDGVSVEIPAEAKAWLQVSGIATGAQSAVVTLSALNNEDGDREATVVFKTTSKGKEYTAQLAVKQIGAIVPVTCAEFLAAEVGTTIYEVTGFITNRTDISGHKFDLVNYGNFDITDASGNVYVYGVGAKGDIATYGVKEGDIIVLNGTRGDYKGTPQLTGGKYVSHKSVTPMTAAEAAALTDEADKTDPKNYIRLTGKVTKPANASNKFDIETYGNFDLVDESGAIYVYGVSTGWNGETKKFSTLGVKEGDIITIVAYKTSYKGAPQVVGMYVSHEAGALNYPSPQTTWRYDIPGDSDGGFMLLTFIDETNCYLTSGDKEGIWWDPADGFSTGTYTYDPDKNTGSAFGTYSLEMTPEGKLSVYGGAFIMTQVDYIPIPEK